MLKITRWFQGSATCAGERLTGNIREPGEAPAHCLLMVLPYFEGAEVRGCAIIERHFGARACRCVGAGPATRIVHFNNHPETTREDVDKVLRIFDEERGRP
mgnify:CR=1 FL=1